MVFVSEIEVLVLIVLAFNDIGFSVGIRINRVLLLVWALVLVWISILV